MRRSQHLDSILEGYRNLAIGIAVVIAYLGVMGWLRLTVDDPALLELWLPMVSLAGLGGLALLLVLGHRWLSRELSQVHVHGEAVRAAAHSDALTGVFTRSYFLEALGAEVHHQSRHAVGYMQIDLDNLKMLNDAAGHGAGDAALVHLARIIAEVAPGAVVGRLGGDEFGVMVRDHDNKQALRRLGEELLRRLGQPVPIGGRPTRVSASIGIAMAPLDAVEADDLIAKADLALYKAKREGRRVVVPFDTGMLADERYRRFVERELRAALLMDELEVHYQPVLGSADLQVRSYEALVRWRHRVRGMIPPSKFIPIAEESDLIDKLGSWVLRRACLDLPALGAGAVAVNVSPAQLRHADFAQRVLAILAETGVEPQRLIVEVTETVPIEEGSVAMANLAALRALGVRLAIDDFGAGYASLHYLRSFAFDIIKIDRTYVANLGRSRIDKMIVAAICDIARSLPVEVVAEGVETEEQKQLLIEAGCTGLQGYLLGPPQPLDGRRSADAA